MLDGSHIIKGRWKTVKKIGQGAFGEIHQAINVATSEMVAIKMERVDSKKQVLKLEVAVLKKLQDCPHVCRFIACGRFSQYNYLVMELLGDNLSEMRRKQSDGKFSLPTTIKLGKQMLMAIEASHEMGYLHRDIKPSNFAIGGTASKRQTVFMIDFGLARRYLLNNGEVRASRDTTGFRGTARYASINSHLCKDLGRRDDLWSLLYVLIEFAKGYLPWRKIKDKDQIGEMKMQFNNADLVADLPVEFLLFMQHLQSLKYEDKPDYSYIQNLFNELYRKIGADENTLFDWEIPLVTVNDKVSIKNSGNIQSLTSSLSQYSNADKRSFAKETESVKSSKDKDSNRDSSNQPKQRNGILKEKNVFTNGKKSTTQNSPICNQEDESKEEREISTSLDEFEKKDKIHNGSNQLKTLDVEPSNHGRKTEFSLEEKNSHKCCKGCAVI